MFFQSRTTSPINLLCESKFAVKKFENEYKISLFKVFKLKGETHIKQNIHFNIKYI